MVHLDFTATVRCDETACEEKQLALLALTAAGGFAFRPEKLDWQVAPGPAGVFVTYCPAHKRRLQVGATGPRVIVEGR